MPPAFTVVDWIVPSALANWKDPARKVPPLTTIDAVVSAPMAVALTTIVPVSAGLPNVVTESALRDRPPVKLRVVPAAAESVPNEPPLNVMSFPSVPLRLVRSAPALLIVMRPLPSASMVPPLACAASSVPLLMAVPPV